MVVIVILFVLAAMITPRVLNYLEKSHETTDLANVRNAYTQVMLAAIEQDTSSPLYTSNGTYLSIVPLKQKKDDWALEEENLSLRESVLPILFIGSTNHAQKENVRFII